MKTLIALFALFLATGCLNPESKKESETFEDPPMAEEPIVPDSDTGSGDEEASEEPM